MRNIVDLLQYYTKVRGTWIRVYLEMNLHRNITTKSGRKRGKVSYTFSILLIFI